MPDYRKMYYILFNAITDAVELLDTTSHAAYKLRTAQMQCENIYIEDGILDEEPISPVKYKKEAVQASFPRFYFSSL